MYIEEKFQGTCESTKLLVLCKKRIFHRGTEPNLAFRQASGVVSVYTVTEFGCQCYFH